MPIITNIRINIDPKEVVLALHHGKRAPEALVDEAALILDECLALLEPRAVYEFVDVKGINAKHIIVLSPKADKLIRIKLGPHASLMSEAREALVSVTTIGHALDHYKQRHDQNGDILKAYLADSIGVVALGQVGEAVRRVAEKKAESLAWGVSPPLAPGSLVGWPLTGQKEICSLLDIQQVGVNLTESGVLRPFKSVSSLIGLGPGYHEKKVGSVCHYCSRAETCWRRRK